MKKQNKGITLVGLVVTIIILLVLAGITISTLSGENGIISKVQEARKAQIGAEIIEKLTLAIQELVIEKNGEATLDDITQEWIDSKLPEYENTVKVDNETNEIIITIKKDDVTKTFIIDENFNITEITTQSSIEISYDIVERTGKTVKILIHMQDKVNGLNRIELPDRDAIIVESNKKQEKAIDYQVEIDVEYKIIVTSDSGEIKEYIILISDFASGNGTEENPYIIMTEEQLRKVKNDLNAHYKLGANIEITSEFEAIGTSETTSTRFNGSLDGDGYKIIGLKNTGTTLQYQGLFGYIDSSGKVSNLTLENIEIKGARYTGGLVGYNKGIIQNIKISGKVYGNVSGALDIGGLVGYNKGTIENCYSSVEMGSSVANINYVGGLVGENDGIINKAVSSGKIIINTINSERIGGLVGNNKGTISNAYSTGNVDGGTVATYVGGLVGYNNGTITNTYTISSVKGRDGYIGGLIGEIYTGSSITNSYWTTETSGVTTSAGGIGTTITYLINKSNLSDKFDFEEIWGIEDGRSTPYLKGMPIPEEIYVMDQGYVTFEGGNGTIDNPYIIKTEEQLRKVKNDLNAHYKLGANIEITSEFEAIGTSSIKFNGSLDGDGYKIIGLRNTATTSDYQGLFGYIGTSGKVVNLTLENVDIKGASNIGGLVGYNRGVIQNVKVSGTVYANASGASDIGGLVGYNISGTIENCYSSVNISSTYTSINSVGGLVGYNSSGTINKVASTGKVTINTSGSSSIGGLVGFHNSGTISNAYTTGEVNTGTYGSSVGGLIGRLDTGIITNTYTISKVIGNSNVGGLIGYKPGGTVTNSYWTTEKSGVTTSEGGIGTTITYLINKSNLSDKFDFEEIWGMEDGRSTPYLKGMPIPEEIYVMDQGYVTFEGGNGTIDNPYIIKTEEQLNKIRYDLNAHYKLGANIEITSEFEAIGTSSIKFNGSLDGDGYKIIGLKNVGTTAQYQGLFGYIDSSGKVSNITLENVNITGGQYTGGLVGYNKGIIQNVKISGTVNKSNGNYIGGLAGYNKGIIETCYTSVEVRTSVKNTNDIGGLVGDNSGTINKVVSSGNIIINANGCLRIGGLVGSNNGTISNAYTTGEVNGGGSYVGGLVGSDSGTIINAYTISLVNGSSNVGGLVGHNNNSSITNSYWTTEKSGVSTSAGGIGTTITYLINKSNLSDKFDFEEIWGIEDGRSTPYLKGMPIPEEIYVMEQGYVTFEGGNGTIDNPYIIKTEEQLNKIRYDLNAHYKLGANIEITSEFEAIGIKDTPFNGSLDGDGYKITELKNVGTTAQYQGLFGYIGKSGKVSNLTLENVEIQGSSYTGGLVGFSLGTIQNVKISGKVTVTASNVNYIGGLVGYNNPGIIENCYSSVDVGLASTYTSISYVGGLVGRNQGTINKVTSSGKVTMNTNKCNNIGGLVGYNYQGTISNAYTTGEVNGNSNVGGLIGQNSTGTITNTYTISKVIGNSNVGGLIGYKPGGTVTNSYWTTEKSGITTSAGGTELTLEQMQTQSSYEGWDFESGTMWIMKTYPELIF